MNVIKCRVVLFTTEEVCKLVAKRHVVLSQQTAPYTCHCTQGLLLHVGVLSLLVHIHVSKDYVSHGFGWSLYK